MDFITEIKNAARILICGNRRDREESEARASAELVGRTISYLSRMCSLTDNVPVNLEVLLPLMKKKRDYRALQRICWECGGVFIKLPKVSNKKGDDVDVTIDYQELTGKTVAALTKAFKNPTDANLRECVFILRNAAVESVSVSKYVEKKLDKQIEIIYE